MKSFISWIGGKGALIDEILPRFPAKYNRYVEVFGGGASVLFAKKQKDNFEVYNDFQSNLVNLFRVVKDKPIAFLETLGFLPLNSREDFKHLKNLLEGNVEFGAYLTEELELAGKYLESLQFEEIKELLTTRAKAEDVNRAVAFFKVIKHSYASGGKTFGCRPMNMVGINLTIFKASERLKGVVIDNKDFEELINQYDRVDSFFYCDPPYYETESHYDAPFKVEDHYRLKETLDSIQGYFLLSYNDCQFIRELYAGYCIVRVTRLNNLKQRYDAGSEFAEVLIANYDISDKRLVSRQINLFEEEFIDE